MSVAIKIEDVSKLYRLGAVGTGTITHDLNRWWHRVRGKEDPYSKVGQINDRTKKSPVISRQPPDSADSANCQLPTANSGPDGPEYVWALRDIDFQVEAGDILGIIGANGAGKSTLLKLLSRVTAPTTGCIKVRGRSAALLEVGTGMHPELTGRENVFMNGAILGMTRREINSQLDAIVDFSGCDKYIDTPVKRFSSGMKVRLGFAVAAHLQCEILIVDEVLAVGDIDFQQKCLSKMDDVATSGRTILFVSHNLSSVSQLCSTGLVLTNGSSTGIQPIEAAIDQYMQSGQLESCEGIFTPAVPNIITSIRVTQNGIDNSTVRHDREFEVHFDLTLPRTPANLRLRIAVCDNLRRKVFTAGPELSAHLPNDPNEPQRHVLTIDERFLMPGRYSIIAGVLDAGSRVLDHHRFVCPFTIRNAGDPLIKSNKGDYGVVFGRHKWRREPAMGN